MRRLTFFILLALLTACSFTLTIEPEFGWDFSTDTVTPVTVTPTFLPTETATIQPTETPTIQPTIQPTPTREQVNRVQLEFAARLRENPSTASRILRTAQAGEQFDVLSQRDGWLNVVDGDTTAWLFNGDWVEFISGDLGNVPVSQAQAQNRLGYNVLEVYNEPYFFNTTEAMCPEYMLVMDNLSLAVRLYEHLNPICGTLVIHRNWHPSDGDEFRVRTPQDFVAQWVREGYPEIIRYSTNEPSCGGATPCSLLVSHEVELARLAREAGFTVSLGNFGVGKYSPLDVVAGVYNPLIEAIVQYGHIFGAHEYSWGCLCFAFGTMPTSYFYDVALMQPSQWVGDIAFDFAPDAQAQYDPDETPFGVEQMSAYVFTQAFEEGCGVLPPYWHMARSFWILLWAECTLDIDTSQIEVVHTEWGWDYMGDIDTVIQDLRAFYGHPQYEGNLRGWRSLSLLWQHWWPDWSTAEAACYQIKWAMQQYPPNHHFLLFAYSDNPTRDWTKAGFSFGNYGDGATIALHRLLGGRNGCTN